MEPFDYTPYAMAIALVVALVLLVWRRWVLPLAVGVLGLLIGGLAIAPVAWRLFAEKDPFRDYAPFGFGDGIDHVFIWGTVAAWIGVAVGAWWSARRARRRSVTPGGAPR